MNSQKITMGHTAAMITIIIWGTTFISTKILLNDFAPIEILFFRFAIGYCTLLLVNAKPLKLKNRKEKLLFAGAGLCGITLYFLLENIALTYTLASNVGVIISIAPFFTALFAHWFLTSEKLRPRFFVGFGAAMIGMILIGFNGNFVLKLNPLGDVLAILAAIVWAIYSILMKKIGDLNYSTIQCTRKVFFYGLIFMIPALFMFDFNLEVKRFREISNLFNILYLGFGASALCFVTWNWAVSILGAVKTSVYIYMVPIITILTSVLILHEKITGIAVIGTIFTMAGLFISESKGKNNVNKECGLPVE